MRKLQLCALLTILIVTIFTPPTFAQIDLSINGEIGYLKPEKSPYLGTQIGAAPNIFNFVGANGKLHLRAKGATLSYTPSANFKIFTSLQNGIANNNQSFNTLDPQGTNLLIPGVGVAPSGAGFLLPGPNNQITNARYDTEHDYYKIMLGLQNEFQTALPNLSITPSFAVGYGRATTQNRFSGNIPFFVRSFSYQSKTRITSISPTIGLDAQYRISPLFKIFGGANYTYDFNHGKGGDSLAFTGFADQVAKIKNDENKPSYALKAGITLTPKNLPEITFQGNYKNFGNMPVIKNRNGTNKSDFSYEEGTIASGTIRATFKF